MAKAKAITLADFISKAQNKHKNKKMTAQIECGDYGIIEFKRPSDSDSLQFLNEMAKSVRADKEGNVKETNLEVMLEASKELVYKTCMYLRDKSLQESLEVFDPLDTPIEVFGINMTIEIAGKIVDEFEDNKVQTVIKN
jgi:hypothetical protein